MTDAERRLWHELKAHRLEGLHFRRQVPLGPYIADFACHAARLIIEVDGGQHNDAEELARDSQRTAWLQFIGYRVLRFWNIDVVTNMEGVIDAIVAAVAGAPQAATSPSLPSPWTGEGNSGESAASSGRAAEAGVWDDLPLCCILAAGRARRMGGGDKALLQLAGKTILDHVIARTKPQVRSLILNANGDENRFAQFGLPVIADSIAGFAGPLAGILAGLEWCVGHGSQWMVSVPADTPFVPHDLVARLRDACLGNDIASAASADRIHPVVGLWPVGLAGELRHALTVEKLHKVDAWTNRYRLGIAEWPAHPYDPFFNINRPPDLVEAERIATEFLP